MNTTTNLILCELQPTNDPQVDSRSPLCIKAHRALKVAGMRYERRCTRQASPASGNSTLTPPGRCRCCLSATAPIP